MNHYNRVYGFLLVEGNPNISQNIVEGQLCADAVDKAEHTHPSEEGDKSPGLDTRDDLHGAVGCVGHTQPTQDQGKQLEDLWDEEKQSQVLEVKDILLLDVLTDLLSEKLVANVTYELSSRPHHNLLQRPHDLLSFREEVSYWTH